MKDLKDRIKRMDDLVGEYSSELDEAIDEVVAELLKIKEVRPCEYKADRAISTASYAVRKLGDAARELAQKSAQLRLLFNLQRDMEG